MRMLVADDPQGYAGDGDILLTNDEMLEALSRYTGRQIVSFTDEPTRNAWWLTVKQ